MELSDRPVPNGTAGSGTSPLPAARTPRRETAYRVFLAAAVLLSASVFWRHGAGVPSFAAFARLLLLAFASVSDLRTHRVADGYSLAMWMSGFYGLQSTGELLGRAGACLGLFLAFVLYRRLSPGRAPGGADGKMAAALSFALGLSGGLCVLLFSCLVCLITVPAAAAVRRDPGLLRRRIAFFPFLTAGLLLYSLL